MRCDKDHAITSAEPIRDSGFDRYSRLTTGTTMNTPCTMSLSHRERRIGDRDQRGTAGRMGAEQDSAYEGHTAFHLASSRHPPRTTAPIPASPACPPDKKSSINHKPTPLSKIMRRYTLFSSHHLYQPQAFRKGQRPKNRSARPPIPQLWTIEPHRQWYQISANE